MNRTKIVLLLVAAGFIGVGMAGLLAPEFLVGSVDISLNSEQARTEIRAMYGGLQIGLGGFLLYAAFKRHNQRPALVMVVFSMVGLACSRLFGIQLEGQAFPWMLPLAFIELGIAVICMWAWTATNRVPEV